MPFFPIFLRRTNVVLGSWSLFTAGASVAPGAGAALPDEPGTGAGVGAGVGFTIHWIVMDFVVTLPALFSTSNTYVPFSVTSYVFPVYGFPFTRISFIPETPPSASIPSVAFSTELVGAPVIERTGSATSFFTDTLAETSLPKISFAETITSYSPSGRSEMPNTVSSVVFSSPLTT